MKLLALSCAGLVTLAILAAPAADLSAQEAPILDYSVDASGQARIRVASSPDDYFILYAREVLPSGAEAAVSMALGAEGTTTLTEALAAYPQAHYRVARFPISDPGDIDGDGIDDVAEFAKHGRLGPFNPAEEIAATDGAVSIADRATFGRLSYQGTEVLIDKHLQDLEFVKFYLLDMNTDRPKVYFMNTETHRAHGQFARAIGIPGAGGGGGGGGGRPGQGAPGQMRGEIVYHPHVQAPSGAFGVYRFEFEPNDSYPFADVRRAYELLAVNFPLLKNNFAYYPMPTSALPRYRREQALYDASRVAIILDEDILAGTGYIPLNLAEGYGRLRVMGLEERPTARDIVLYPALPNELPRVGGIITTVPQTPLSHVNLRAIQDQVPNAYIAGALDDEAVKGLVGKYVYYRVDRSDYELREASLAEVEAWYAARRPAQPQTPQRDLSAKAITPLAELRFEDWNRYGVKAANLATLGRLGFPEGRIPDGYAIPFHFYDEFMRFNGFYDEVRKLLADPAFASDYSVQDAQLALLRDRIEAADMPPWMLDALAAMQASFPAGTSLRCRSSTNNEDLPRFSGAGLYDSYTQHPDEGHIAKSVKQVYASLWNFRAFDERQFYRIDHFATAMGVLVHPNYEGELSNGVGVTTDPIYQTADTYYLNTQVGEDLVTNPDALSIPEEILLGAAEGSGYTIVRRSNQVADSAQVMSAAHLAELRGTLNVIHAEFHRLYGIRPGEAFAMEIEYKITADGVLAIKQARPWLFDEADAPDVHVVFVPFAVRGAP